MPEYIPYYGPSIPYFSPTQDPVAQAVLNVMPGYTWNGSAYVKDAVVAPAAVAAWPNFTKQSGITQGSGVTATSNTITVPSGLPGGGLAIYVAAFRSSARGDGIAIDGGLISINGGAFVTTGTIHSGDTLAVKTGTLLLGTDARYDYIIKNANTTLATFIVATLAASAPAPPTAPAPTAENKPTTVPVLTGYADVTVSSIASVSSTIPAQVSYRLGGTANAATETSALTAIELDLTPGYAETIVSGSVRFVMGGRTYVDRNGQLYYNIDSSTGAGTYGGTIDYSTGICIVTAWASGASPIVTIQSLTTTMNFQPVSSAVMRTPAAPIKPGVFQVRASPVGGGTITATALNTGEIQSDYIQGFIEYDTGVVRLAFGQWVTAAGNEGEDWYDVNGIVGGLIFQPRYVYADTIFYNTVAYTYLPLSAAILGLDPVRLPSDGRVPVYAPGDVVVVLNDQTSVGTFTSGGTLDLGRVRLAKLTIRDAAGNALDSAKYSADLDTGIITWGDLTGISQPISIVDRIEDMAVLSDVQITGQLALSQPLTHDFPVLGTLVSNAIVYGTIYARISVPFDQQTWTNVWSDVLIGNSVAAQYNNTQYPIVVNNASCIAESWICQFTSSTAFNVIGKNIGQIVTGGSTSTATAPINPNTGEPYFTIPAEGWGGGWASGNVLRFNTYSANVPVWVIQAIAQGEATDTDYTLSLELRGDIDAI